MEVEPERILEERKELLVSPPIKRNAHFLKPSISSFPPDFDPKICASVFRFNGWKCPQKDWKNWVQKMAPLHEPTWRKAGIFEAILNSTYRIWKNDDLIFGVAEKWFNETKSFIFPWGEASITLEDMMALGGYSVFGSPVFSPLETVEMRKIEEKLKKEKEEKGRKWIKKFMDSDSNSEIEHVAFLALWLSRFVFPSRYNKIEASFFPVAIRLAKGTRIALAPAVLASIYCDLSSLKRIIVATKEMHIHGKNKNVKFGAIVLCSPLHLVQVWVWERFILLRPAPNLRAKAELRLARWHGLKCRVNYVRAVLDSGKESFVSNPYALEEKKKLGDSVSGTPNQDFDIGAKKELNISLIPPGFPSKRKMVEEKGIADHNGGSEVERKGVDTGSLVRTWEVVLDSRLVQKEHENLHVSMVEARSSVNEDDMTIGELLESFNSHLHGSDSTCDEDQLTLRELLTSMEKSEGI